MSAEPIMMSILFAKLDPGFFENRKVIKAGRNGRDVFLLAMCMNAARGAIGWIPAQDLEPWYIARRVGITEEEAKEGLKSAIDAELLAVDDNAIRLVGWAPEWARIGGKSDAERAKAYRERKRQGDPATSPESPQDAKTGPSRSDAREDSQDREDTTVRHEASQASRDASRDRHGVTGSEREERRERTARDAPLPPTWEPSAEGKALALELELDCEQEAKDMRRYVLSRGWKRADWNAAFLRWLDKSPNRKKPAVAPQTKPQTVRSVDSMGNPIDVVCEPNGELRRAR